MDTPAGGWRAKISRYRRAGFVWQEPCIGVAVGRFGAQPHWQVADRSAFRYCTQNLSHLLAVLCGIMFQQLFLRPSHSFLIFVLRRLRILARTLASPNLGQVANRLHQRKVRLQSLPLAIRRLRELKRHRSPLPAKNNGSISDLRRAIIRRIQDLTLRVISKLPQFTHERFIRETAIHPFEA